MKITILEIYKKVMFLNYYQPKFNERIRAYIMINPKHTFLKRTNFSQTESYNFLVHVHFKANFIVRQLFYVCVSI